MITCWRGSMIGLPEMISWSLPKAMFEPQNEIAPTTVENIRKIITSVATSSWVWSPAGPSGWKWRNSTQAISATAPPPTPLNSATICGIAVIFTERAEGTPISVPSATAIAIRA